MKKKICLISFISLFIIAAALSQDRYSIDSKQKKRRVPVKYFILDTKTKIVEAKEWRKSKRIENRNSKKTKKRVRRHQSRETKKKVKQLERRAKVFNRGKLPWSVKLRQKIYKWMK